MGSVASAQRDKIVICSFIVHLKKMVKKFNDIHEN
jgi:hypothetical protein